MFYKVFGVQLGEEEIQTDLPAEEKQTHREQACDCQGRGWGREVLWEFGVSRYTRLDIEWLNNNVP